jgi:hypothetical protein
VFTGQAMLDGMTRTALAAVFVAVVIGLPAGAVASALANRPQIRFNSADQAAARATVLRRADLGSAGWTGGPVKPDLSSTMSCPNHKPKLSDLVLTGAAEADFHHAGIEVQSVAQVLKTRSMVARDWKRTVVNPRAVTCLRHMLTKQLTSNQQLVSFRKLAFPRLAQYVRAYRLLIAVRAQAQRVLVMVDVVLVGRSRTELTLTVAAPAAARASISRAEVRLARRLLARVRA